MTTFWPKAEEAARSARLLVDAGDPNGATNRAYYAMFNAARAALAARTSLPVEDIRRHTAVLQLFSLHLIKPGLIEAGISADLNEVFRFRAVADYDEMPLSMAEAHDLLAAMERMLTAVRSLLKEPRS
jgi:uncharacterized protein (UPF0332 family)